MSEQTAGVPSYIWMSRRTKTLVMAGALLGLFTTTLNATIINTAVPRIIGSLGHFDLLPWTFPAFMLTSTTSMPIVGKLTDVYGRKPFLVGALAVFLVGSVLAGFSQSMYQLIAFRAVQGLGSGMVMTLTFILAGDVFEPRERARWSGITAAILALSNVIGPLVGGTLTDHVGWRSVFFVNVPVGLTVMAVVLIGMPAINPSNEARRLDYAGVPLVLGTMVPLLLALSWAGKEFAWLSPQIMGLLGASLLAAIALWYVESRAEDPLLPLSLFRNPVFSVAVTVNLILGFGLFGSISYAPTFVQGVIGSSATSSGFVLMPMAVAMTVSSLISGQLIYHLGRSRWMGTAGVGVVALAMFLFTTLDVDSVNLSISRNMVLVGIGLGMAMPVYRVAVQNTAPYRLLGAATSTMQFMWSVGNTMGVAIVGSIVNSRLGDHLAATTPLEVKESVPPETLKPLEDPQAILDPTKFDAARESFLSLGDRGADLFDSAVLAVRSALAQSITDGFTFGFLMLVVALTVSLFLREKPAQEPADEVVAFEGETGSAAPSLATDLPASDRPA